MNSYAWLIQRLLPRIQYHQHVYAEALNNAIRPGAYWLDLGAGTKIHGGWIGPSSAALAANAQFLVGCDPGWRHLRMNKFLRGRVACFGETLPFRAQSFDVVSANMVLEHLPSPLPVFREVQRVLKPGGVFVFVTPNRLHPAVAAMAQLMSPTARRRWAKRLEAHRQTADIFATHYQANSTKDVLRLAGGAKLGIVRLEVFRSWPMVRHFPPAIAAECLWIRLSGIGPLRRFGSNIIGVLRRT